MTTTLISLISILIGIISANTLGLIYKKYSFDFTGNTIAGVFGSIFLIKSFGRIGFGANHIITENQINIIPFIINIIVSTAGGILALIILKKIHTRLNKNTIG